VARTIPFPFVDHVPPSRDALPGLATFGATVRALIAEYELALGDVDKSGDPENAWFHEGRLAALEQSLVLLLDVPQDVWGAHHVR